LDLFCGAGGAAMGYHRAGFDVVGVDIEPQPHYPFEFHQGDALVTLQAYIDTGVTWAAAIHASPPCKAHTKTGWSYHFDYHSDHADLLTPTRQLLENAGVPWVIENVPGAPMRVDLMLCGSQFGLGVRRHRWFEFSHPPFELMAPCVHPRHVVTPLGNPNAARGSRREWADAMGIDWMTSAAELSQAIPPAYTEYIGRRLMTCLTSISGLCSKS
jgi:DNA (cytosine-5)-methyltransferase 1